MNGYATTVLSLGVIWTYCEQHYVLVQYKPVKEILSKLWIVMPLLLAGMFWRKPSMLVCLIGMFIINVELLFFSFYHAQIGGKCYLFFVVLPGLLIRLIKRLGKISIPGCKLEYWIYMVLSLLRITGKMFSSTCFFSWKWRNFLLGMCTIYSWSVCVNCVFELLEYPGAWIRHAYLLSISLVFV